MVMVKEDSAASPFQGIEGFPLSPQQRRLWSVQRAAGGAFRALALLHGTGVLDPPRLAAALQRVAARHEILRTSFRGISGMALPRQVIGDSSPSLRILEGDLDALWQAAESAALDLENGPALQVWAAPAGANGHDLALALPALCCDAAGLESLAGEIAEAYAAGESWEPSEDPVQYIDVAQALEDLSASTEAVAAREHWEQHGLSAAGEPLPVALLGAEGPDCSFQPAWASLPVSSGLGNAVAGLASRLGVPMPAVLLAAGHALLFRLAGRPFTIGASFAGRSYEGLERAVGLLTRYLPVRPELDGETPFAELARRVDAALRFHQERQELFDWEKLAPAEVAFAACFDLDDLGAGSGLVRCRVVFDRFALRFAPRLERGELTLDLGWDAACLPEEEALRLGGHYQRLLWSAAEAPEAAVADLEILSDAQRRGVLALLDGGTAPRPEACLHDLVLAQAARTPGAVAVTDEAGELTYAALAERSHRLAAHLRRLGIGPEVRVGVCVERSNDLLLALLGILRAGGAYVPLDPSYPADRLAFMQEDSALPVVLTQRALLGLLPESQAVTVLLDDPASWTGSEAEPAAVSPDSLAYVLYTSGSTGQPKGVMVSHRAILNRLLWMQERYPLAAGDRVLQKTPASFDASIWELFCPLLAGAATVMARPGGHQDTAYLAEAVAAHRISVLQLVPSLLRPFLDEPAAGDCRSLRRLFCGGEALAADLHERVARKLPQVRLINLYGPTEAAIDATSWPCDGPAGAAVTPIGRPLPNVRVALLNERLRLVPPGTVGELAIGGVNLARGYLGLPGLTAGKFVPDPFGADHGRPGERLFRSGDLARCRPDGTIDFLGRADHQVKLRGTRIELGEIEAALRRVPGVAECVAAVREDRPGTQRLVAYVVPAAEARERDLAAIALREQLGRSLPESMVPAAFVTVPALPRLPNGKVDRAALPVPPADQERPGREPSGPAEELLAGIWCEVLKLDRVRADDDFFEQGGHSLLATQVLSRLRDAFGIALPMRTLFQTPKLADLAAEAEAALRTGSAPAEPPLERVPRHGPLPASFGQERLFFLDRLQPGGHAYNLPVALRLRGEIDVQAMEAVWSEIRRRHETLRTTFSTELGVPVQRIAPPAPLVLPVTDLSGVPAAGREEAALRIVREESRRPFDLERGPLLRVALLRRAADDWILLMSTHHIVSDAWSTGLLIRELKVLYRAFSEGRTSPLPELMFQYADFAHWERRWMRDEALAAQLGFWREHLAGAPTGIDLPLDGIRPPVQTFRGGSLARPLGPELTAALDAMARREGATVYMVLLAAWMLLLHHLSGQSDLVVGASIANRNRTGVEGIVGFFVNMLPMRTDLAGCEVFREVLRRVRETALSAFAHQDLPFATLVESMRLGRDISRNPVFQVVFTFENAHAEPLELPGIEVTPVPYGVDTTVFDLALVMWRTAEGLVASLRYSSDLFRPNTIERLLDQLRELMSAVAARPDAPLADLRSLLAEVDQRHREARERELEEAGARKLRNIRRQTVTTGQEPGVVP